MASFSVSGLVPMSAAIAGSEVAMTVESMFSMNRAVATMSGIRRCLFACLFIKCRQKPKGRKSGLYHPFVIQAIAEAAKKPKCYVTENTGGLDDLHPRSAAAAGRPARERPALLGD